MPKFKLEISAHLDGVKSISAPPDYPWHIILLCGKCGEKTEKPVVVSDSDQVEGLRGAVVNLRISCKLCKRASDLKILKSQLCYTIEECPEWGALLELECRGSEPLKVLLADDVPLKMEGLEGFVFEDAFIEDDEFFSYDEDLNTEASVTEFTSRIVKG